MRILFSLTITFFLIGLRQGFAQKVYLNPLFDSSADPESVETVLLPTATSLGSYYLSKDWYIGRVLAKNGTRYENFYLRYDILRNQIEMIVGRKIKILKGDRVQSFEWFNTDRLAIHTFINAKIYHHEGNLFNGFLQIIEDGEIQILLLSHISFFNAQATPSVAQLSNEVLVLEELYLAKDYELFKVKKKNQAIFEPHLREIQVYMKENNLKIRENGDLKQIIRYYNQLNLDQKAVK